MSGTGDSVAQDTMSASCTASSRSSAMVGSIPAAESANAVEIACERVRFQSVTRVIGRTARWARTRYGASAPAPTMTRCEASSRDRNREASAEAQAVRQAVSAAPSITARSLAGVAGHQDVAAEHRRLVLLGVVGKHVDELVADEPLAGRRPGWHQQDFCLAAGRLRDEIRDLVRRRDVGAKRLGERVDQRVVAQHAIDVVGGDDRGSLLRSSDEAHAAGGTRNGGDASTTAGKLRRGSPASSRARRIAAPRLRPAAPASATCAA